MPAEIAPLEIAQLALELQEMVIHRIVDEARVRQAKVRINYLLSTGKAERETAHEALMIAAYIINDVEDVVRHALALSALPNIGKIAMQNAGVVLSYVGQVRQSLQIFRSLAKTYPLDKESLYGAILHLQIGLAFDEAVELFPSYEKIIVNEDNIKWRIVKDAITNSQRRVASSGFSNEDLLIRLEVAIKGLRACGYDVRRQSRYTLEDGTFISQFYVDADEIKCAALNFEIADALVEEFSEVGAEFFSVCCRPLSHYNFN